MEDTFTITMTFKMFDQDAFDDALNDLQAAGVWGEGEGPDDNTIEENLDILVCHMDVLATYRERENVAWYDVGLERVEK
jgi:hypothetical protein